MSEYFTFQDFPSPDQLDELKLALDIYQKNITRRRRERIARRIGIAMLSIVGVVSLQVARSKIDENELGKISRIVKIDDANLRLASDDPIEVKLSDTAASISGDINLLVTCGDLTSLDTDPTDEYVTMGAYIRPDQTVSGKAIILLDTLFCDLIDIGDKLTKRYNYRVGDAVFALAHELGHAQGVRDESQANCLGVELFPEVADSLGLHEFLKEISPLDMALNSGSAKYHQTGC